MHGLPRIVGFSGVMHTGTPAVNYLDCFKLDRQRVWLDAYGIGIEAERGVRRGLLQARANPAWTEPVLKRPTYSLDRSRLETVRFWPGQIRP